MLRHLILADAKSATYKLGLLRALCRAADGAAGWAEEDGEDHIRLPLGLIALNWLRLYLPMTAANLPQAPGNRAAAEGLGFAGSGWTVLAAGAASQRDLRVGAVFGHTSAVAVHAALREATDHVCRMPATYLTFPGGGRILETTRTRAARPPGSLTLDGATLAAFGSMRVPKHLWTALQRFAAWIEPALMSEWTRLMQGYATSQGRLLDVGIMATAMTWADPARDVALPRARALALLEAGQVLHCVWSGKRLSADSLDVDHCLPWSAWPCGDLWNLVPADRRVNQHGKRDCLPSADALRAATGPIEAWWSAAYLRPVDAPTTPRPGTRPRIPFRAGDRSRDQGPTLRGKLDNKAYNQASDGPADAHHAADEPGHELRCPGIRAVNGLMLKVMMNVDFGPEVRDRPPGSKPDH